MGGLKAGDILVPDHIRSVPEAVAAVQHGGTVYIRKGETSFAPCVSRSYLRRWLTFSHSTQERTNGTVFWLCKSICTYEGSQTRMKAFRVVKVDQLWRAGTEQSTGTVSLSLVLTSFVQVVAWGEKQRVFQACELYRSFRS